VTVVVLGTTALEVRVLVVVVGLVTEFTLVRVTCFVTVLVTVTVFVVVRWLIQFGEIA